MYYAKNPNVATEYQKRLSGKTTFGERPSDSAYVHAVESFRDANYPLEQIPAEMKKAYKSITDKDIQLAIQASEKGNLYKVDVPDEYIPKMLDFDSPINKQPKEFVELLKDVSKNENFDPFEHMALAQTIGKHPRNAPNYKPTGEELINNVSDILGIERNSAEFSKIMKEYGIKGIKYADEGSRNWRILPPDESVSGKWTVGKWPGGGKETKYFDNEKDANEYLKQNYTSNFVVFDPKEVKILEKNSKPVNTLENVVAPLKEKGLTLDIYESKNNPNKLVLSKIEVPKELRKSGVGSNAMQELTGFADKENKTITLSPSTDFGGSSVSRLKDFYKRFGFVENKGRHKDYSISESMYRLPTKLSRKDIIEEQVNNLK
jgi:predicted GNAT family acetyltransferase